MKQSAVNPKKLIKIIVWCILGAIALFVIIVLSTLLVQKYVKKTPVPMFAGYGSLIVITGSMNGTIDEGDMIIIKRMDPEEYKLTDIVTYVNYRGELVTHRLVRYGEEEGTFYALGDNNNGSEDDRPVSRDQIQGVVVLTIPKVGIFYNWFLHDGGYIYAISLLIVVFVGIYLWGRIKDSEPNKAESSADEPQTDSPETAQVSEASADNSDSAQPKEE